jgi:hypothetical protein
LNWPKPGLRALALVVLSAALLSLSACKRKKGSDLDLSNTVRGKVTYKGEPVRYGVVLLFHPEKSFDQKTGVIMPIAVAPINKDGNYETTKAPSGPIRFAVACDPDVMLFDLMKPSTPGAAPGGNVAMQGPNKALGGPNRGLLPPPPPPGSKELEGGPLGPGKDDPHPGKISFNPMLKDFSDEEKEKLREVHKKFGTFVDTPIMRIIEVGEQTFDLKLE